MEGNIREIIDDFKAKNIKIWTEEGKLKYRAPQNVLSNKDIQILQNNKKEIIEYLLNDKNDLSIGAGFPLSSIQKAYFLGNDSAYELGDVNAHYYMELDCEKIDAEAFQLAVNEVIANTDALRIIVLPNGTQKVLETVRKFEVEKFYFNDEIERLQIRDEWSHCKYDLQKWPLFNFRLSYVEEKKPRLHIDFDCIIMDAWSAKMMITKIFEVYERRQVDWSTYTFEEYCKDQVIYKEHHPEKEAQEYWANRVKSLPPAPKLRYKKPLSEIHNHRFRRLKRKLGKEETHKLYQLAKENRITPAAVICTIYMKVLAKYSGNAKFTLNLTLFNRLPINNEVQNIIGDFTNIGVVEHQEKKETFINEVRFVQKQLWELVRYHTFDGTNILKMIKHKRYGQAILPVVFTGVLQGERNTKRFIPNYIEEGYAISQTPQVVLDYQATDFDKSLLINWDYVEEAFDESVIIEMFQENIRMLLQVLETDWAKVI